MAPPSRPDLEESPEAVGSFRRRLLRFFDERARPLPWRATSDSYAIWVSEIMAQQTRVETVVPYYDRWLERFPTVTALADAPLDDVLKAWEGLGYYSRARNLHRAAGVVVEEHGGRLPETAAELRTLPGIGAYTAGAIASIAFERPVPAVDGNVRRVHARLRDEPAPTPAAVRRWAARVVDPDRPGDFNQALMELGATVCTPRSPDCPSCPVAGHCAARAAGTVDERPAPRRRTKIRREERAVGVFVAGAPGRVLLRRRDPDGLLGGMWEFPSIPLEAAPGNEVVAEAVLEMATSLGLRVSTRPGVGSEFTSRSGALEPVLHRFSHLHVTYHPWVLRVRAGSPVAGEHRWVDPIDTGDVALPVAQQRMAALAAEAVAAAPPD